MRGDFYERLRTFIPHMSNTDKAGAVPANKDGTTQSQNIRPEWLRLPKPGQRCPASGLCRSYLHTLVRDGKVKTSSIRERGRKTGIRLISYDSLMAFIEKGAQPAVEPKPEPVEQPKPAPVEQAHQEGGAQ